MAVTVPSSAIPANHQPERHQASGGSDRVVIAVSDGGHGGDRPPGRVAEVADVGIGAGSFGIEYGQGGAEGQQGSATGDIDSDSTRSLIVARRFCTDNSGIGRSSRRAAAVVGRERGCRTSA